jgi:hypothetical protein
LKKSALLVKDLKNLKQQQVKNAQQTAMQIVKPVVKPSTKQLPKKVVKPTFKPATKLTGKLPTKETTKPAIKQTVKPVAKILTNKVTNAKTLLTENLKGTTQDQAKKKEPLKKALIHKEAKAASPMVNIPLKTEMPASPAAEVAKEEPKLEPAVVEPMQIDIPVLPALKEEPKLEPAVVEPMQIDIPEPLISTSIQADPPKVQVKSSGTRVKLASLLLLTYGLIGTGVSVTSLILLFNGELYANPFLGPIFTSIIGNAKYIGPPMLALSLISLLTGLSLLFPNKRIDVLGKLIRPKNARL